MKIPYQPSNAPSQASSHKSQSQCGTSESNAHVDSPVAAPNVPSQLTKVEGAQMMKEALISLAHARGDKVPEPVNNPPIAEAITYTFEVDSESEISEEDPDDDDAPRRPIVQPTSQKPVDKIESAVVPDALEDELTAELEKEFAETPDVAPQATPSNSQDYRTTTQEFRRILFQVPL